MWRVLALLVVAAGACGSSGGPCESANQKMCDKACACPSSDGKCHMKAAGFTLSFTRGGACFGAVLGCSDTAAKQYDWAACSSQLDTAQCTTLTGTTDQAIEMPAACVTRIPDGGP